MTEEIEQIDRRISAVTLERMLLRIDSRIHKTPFPVEQDEALGRRQWQLWAEREGLVSDEIRVLLSPEPKTINDRGLAFPVFVKCDQ